MRQMRSSQSKHRHGNNFKGATFSTCIYVTTLFTILLKYARSVRRLQSALAQRERRAAPELPQMSEANKSQRLCDQHFQAGLMPLPSELLQLQ